MINMSEHYKPTIGVESDLCGTDSNRLESSNQSLLSHPVPPVNIDGWRAFKMANYEPGIPKKYITQPHAWNVVTQSQTPTHSEYPPAGYGVGLAGLIVIDVDVEGHEGANPMEIFEALLNWMPSVFSVLPSVASTPSGGLHFYFRAPSPQVRPGREPVPYPTYRKKAWITYDELPESVRIAGVHQIDMFCGPGSFVYSVGTKTSVGEYKWLSTKGGLPEPDGWRTPDDIRKIVGLPVKRDRSQPAAVSEPREYTSKIDLTNPDSQARVAKLVGVLRASDADIDAWTVGKRHSLALGVAGVLRRLGVTEREALDVISVLGANDEELSSRLNDVATTYGQPETGVGIVAHLGLESWVSVRKALFVPLGQAEVNARLEAEHVADENGVPFESQKEDALMCDLSDRFSQTNVSFAYICKSELWYAWNISGGGIWQEVSQSKTVMSFLGAMFRDKSFSHLNELLRKPTDSESTIRFCQNKTNLTWIIDIMKREYGVEPNEEREFFTLDPRYLYLLDCVVELTVSQEAVQQAAKLRSEYVLVEPVPEHHAFHRLSVPLADVGRLGPSWESIKNKYPNEWPKLWDYLKLMLWGYDKSQVFCMIVGPRNTGKSMIVDAIRHLWGTSAGIIDPAKYTDGARFFGNGLIGKRVGINGEIQVKQWSTDAVGWLKTVTGGECQMEFERKFQDSITCDFRPLHLLFSANQLPDLPLIGSDAEAVYRRCVLVVLDKLLSPSEVDEGFGEKLKAELPELVRLILDEGVQSFWDNRNRDVHTKETGSMWKLWSNPLLKVLMDMYERGTGTESISQTDVINDILPEMNSRGFSCSTDEIALRRQVTECFSTMGIVTYRKQTGRQVDTSYRPLVRRTSIITRMGIEPEQEEHQEPEQSEPNGEPNGEWEPVDVIDDIDSCSDQRGIRVKSQRTNLKFTTNMEYLASDVDSNGCTSYFVWRVGPDGRGPPS